MQMLTDRQKQILSLLVNSEDPIRGKTLAEELGVSLRTIQLDIARINHDATLIVGTDKGYVASPSLVREFDAPSSDSSRNALADHTLLQLITKQEGSVTVEDLSESLFMSTSAVERRLRGIRKRIETFDLHLVKHKGKLHIEGSEINKRKLIGSLVAEEVTAGFSSCEGVASYFGDMDIERVKAIVTASIDCFGLRTRNGYGQNLVANIAIALYRMRSNIHIPPAENTLPSRSLETNIAHEICSRYAEHRAIAPNTGDLNYLASLLVGHIERKTGFASSDSDFKRTALVTTVEDIVSHTLETFMLHVDSPEALYAFSMHVQALVERCGGVQLSDTDVLENVKLNCPFVHELSLRIAQDLEQAFDIRIGEGELGFICIHVGMLIEGVLAEDKLSILLICDQYQRIANRIRSQAAERYTQIATVIERSLDDASQQELLNADLVITTRKDLALAPNVVEISPFFTTSDHLKVENAIGMSFRRKKSQRIEALTRPFFDERLFFWTTMPADRDEVIRFLANAVYEAGFVDKQFTSDVLRREELSPTCFFNLFAVPHSLEMNAHKTVISVFIDPEGIAWGTSTIRIAILIAVCQDDRPRFMEIYDTIVKALCDKARVSKLMRAHTLDEFIKMLVY